MPGQTYGVSLAVGRKRLSGVVVKSSRAEPLQNGSARSIFDSDIANVPCLIGKHGCTSRVCLPFGRTAVHWLRRTQ
jgi:hypothetical protein